MTNLPTTFINAPIAEVAHMTLPKGQSYKRLLTQRGNSQAIEQHAMWIGVRVEALLDGYWDKRPHPAVVEEIMADWMEALGQYTPGEIRKACRAYLNGPDRARKPKSGDIADLASAARPMPVTPVEPEPEPRKPLTPEQKAEADAITARYRAMSNR